MQAANEGAFTAPERGAIHRYSRRATFRADVKAFVAQVFQHRTLFTRLHQFAIASGVFIVAPYAIGTLL